MMEQTNEELYNDAYWYGVRVREGWVAEDIPYMKISNDLKLICEIYHYDKALKKPIWLSLAVDNLSWVMGKFDVWASFDALSDWGLIYREAGDLGNGRSGFMWHLYDYHLDTTKELYEKYWRDYRRTGSE